MTVLGAGDVLAAKGIRIKADLFGYSGAAFPYTGVDLAAPMLYGATAPSAWTGFHMPDHGAGLGAVATPVTGLHIEDQTLVTGAVHLLELGPATPYLRLLGGGNPDAHESNLLLGLGATLKLVTEYDADSAGVGFRALRVPN